MKSSQKLEEWLQEFFDGTLPPEKFSLLERELKTNPEARDMYRECLHLNNALQMQLESPVESLQGVVPIEQIIRRQKRKALRLSLYAAAAVILVTLLVLGVFHAPRADLSLAFKTAPGTLYSVTHSQSDLGESQVMEAGSRLVVHQGVVELTFASGVGAIVEGPADLTLHDDGSLYQHEGQSWFSVPPEAVGFRVKTHELDIVDLGTKFGVKAGPDLVDEVHVFEGRVQVTTRYKKEESSVVSAGGACRGSVNGSLENIAPAAGSFLDSLPRSLPYFYWSCDDGDSPVVGVGELDNPGRPVELLHGEEALVAQDGKAAGRYGEALRSRWDRGFELDWFGPHGDAPRTIAFWIKVAGTSEGSTPVIGWGHQGGHNDPHLNAFYAFLEKKANEPTVSGLAFGGHWYLGKTPLDDKKWHHLVFTYSGKAEASGEPEVRCYLNGKPEPLRSKSFKSGVKKREDGVTLDVDTFGEFDGGSSLWIFGDPWDVSWGEYAKVMHLDEVFIFRGALTESEVRELYLKNSPVSPGG